LSAKNGSGARTGSRILTCIWPESCDMAEDLARVLPPHRAWNKGGDRAVLALHCSLAHAGAWSGMAEALDGVTLTAIDQIGHGRAPDWDGRADMHGCAALAAIAMAEDIGRGTPVDLMGHSFGATVCLRIALERPDLVRSMTLVEPVLFAAARAAGHAAYPPFRIRHQALAAHLAAGRRRDAAVDFHGYWGSGEHFDDLAPRMQTYILDRMHLIPAQNDVLLEDSAGLLQYMGLESIGVPVLLVEGAQSPPIIAGVHAELARRLPQATRLSVAGAGHMVPITHAAALAPAVMAHLASA
jgi:lipase